MGSPSPDGLPGRIYGELNMEEDADGLARLLVHAPRLVLESGLGLLTHADDRPHIADDVRRAEKASKREALARGQLKRYVFAADTTAGRRIIKIAESVSVGNHLLGLFSSVARREHRYHRRCQDAGLAACRSLGFLEWRSGPHLRRALQVQEPVADGSLLLEPFFARQLAEHDLGAIDSLAEAVAATHRARFFHADLKAFHAYVDVIEPWDPNAPARYRLRWIDLARVSFRLSHRQRIINLYQCFRFVLPSETPMQERFMTTYCRAADWHPTRPDRPLATVRRLLAHKLVSHPNP